MNGLLAHIDTLKLMKSCFHFIFLKDSYKKTDLEALCTCRNYYNE